MSLNGLDAVGVNEAYLAALGEGGGWFLLQYTSRAEVGLLRKGTGGIQEAKETVTQYVEQSPLYGFLQYRRRKVLLKYVPEGTSRLLQARLTVHFQSVAEKFSPHDTIFSFTSASELIDSALSAACSLHTAPASIKSSTSLRQKGLAGITEDASENQATVSPSLGAEQETAKSTSVKDNNTRLDGVQDNIPSPPVEPKISPAPSSRTLRNTDKALPPTPDSPIEDERPKKSIDHGDFHLRSSIEGRQSSQSTRPTTRDGYSALEYKPKVKLGPRPSIDSNSGNPGSDLTSRPFDPRPVSTLPASVRMPARKAVSSRPVPPRRPRTSGAQQSPEMKSSVASAVGPRSNSISSTSTAPAQRPVPKPVDTMPIRPLAAEPKTPTMTPEKKRLLKALELRQKQLAAQKKEQPRVLDVPDQSEPMKVTKLNQDDELLRSSLEAAQTPQNPDLLRTTMGDDASGVIHIGNVDLLQGNSAKADVSPISVPEASDGPSTQASSVSDEEPSELEKETDPQNKSMPDRVGLVTSAPMSDTADKAAHDYSLPDIDLATESLQSDLGLDAGPSGHQEGNSEPNAPVIAHENPHSRPNSERRDTIISQLHVKDATVASCDVRGSSISHNSEETAQTAAPVEPYPEDTSIGSPSQEAQQPRSRSMSREVDFLTPHEVPLPPVDEDEEMQLRPQQAPTSDDQIARHSPPILNRTQASPQISQPKLEDDRMLQAPMSTDTRPSMADTVGDRRSVRQNRRHGLVEPVRRISSGENSDDQFLSDDSFMEELKCATVQEAKPISVSKSPITSVFPRPSSEQRPDSKATRSVSTPLESHQTRDKDVLPQSSTLLSPRSVSVSKARSTSPSNTSPPMLGKVGVSSGISQRIRALEKLQSRPTSPSSQLSSPANTPAPFASLGARKSSFRSRPGTSDRPHSRQALLSSSPVLSPTTNFEVAHPKPYNQFVSVKVASKPGKSRPESISVTARIVRDDRNQTPEVPRDASEPRVMDLYHSPLKVEHKAADVKPTSSKKPPIKRHSTAPSISSNSTDHRSEPMLSSKRDSLASGSNGSRRGSDTELPRSVSEISLSGTLGGDGGKEEKKESRKSRLLKRMSNSMAASRRSIATALSPPPVREDSIAEQHEPIQESPPTAVEIGDVNIQFPDTLLWKRRHMAIDSQGIVILSPSKADNNPRLVTKRYSLTEFFPPYIPDQDRQEMPNSVNLDFKDGSTLQCACENLHGQAQVLGILTQAHHLHNNK